MGFPFPAGHLRWINVPCRPSALPVSIGWRTKGTGAMGIWDGLVGLLRDLLAGATGGADQRSTAAELRRLFADDFRDHEEGPHSRDPDTHGTPPRV